MCAHALQAFFIKAAKMGIEMQNDCAEFKIRAERKVGEFLQQMEKQRGRPSPKRSHDVTLLRDLGIEKTQSHRWQQKQNRPCLTLLLFWGGSKAVHCKGRFLIKSLTLSTNSGNSCLKYGFH